MSEVPSSALADAIIDYVEKLVEYEIRYQSVGEDGHHVSADMECWARDEAEGRLRKSLEVLYLCQK